LGSGTGLDAVKKNTLFSFTVIEKQSVGCPVGSPVTVPATVYYIAEYNAILF
jgi:hypothetical protein